jgi:hypothetical protein
MKVRHVLWMNPEGKQGRVGVIECGDVISMRNLSRKKLPAEVLFGVLDATIKDWMVRAEVLHLHRRHSWAITTRRGMSGCTTLFLRVQKDSLFLNHPIVAKIHITMSGYIENFEMWLGDLAPLAARLRNYFPQLQFHKDGYVWISPVENGSWSLKVVEPIERNFEPAGNPSGLVDGIPEEFWRSLEQQE